jgi:hypothetical protein
MIRERFYAKIRIKVKFFIRFFSLIDTKSSSELTVCPARLRIYPHRWGVASTAIYGSGAVNRRGIALIVAAPVQTGWRDHFAVVKRHNQWQP